MEDHAITVVLETHKERYLISRHFDSNPEEDKENVGRGRRYMIALIVGEKDVEVPRAVDTMDVDPAPVVEEVVVEEPLKIVDESVVVSSVAERKDGAEEVPAVVSSPKENEATDTAADAPAPSDSTPPPPSSTTASPLVETPPAASEKHDPRRTKTELILETLHRDISEENLYFGPDGLGISNERWSIEVLKWRKTSP